MRQKSIVLQVDPVKHNKELSALAQEWAQKLAADGKLSHSNASYKGKELGENVASKWSSAGADYTGIKCREVSVFFWNVHLEMLLWTSMQINVLCADLCVCILQTGEGVTEQWYSEHEKYDFKSPGFKQGW